MLSTGKSLPLVRLWPIGECMQATEDNAWSMLQTCHISMLVVLPLMPCVAVQGSCCCCVCYACSGNVALKNVHLFIDQLAALLCESSTIPVGGSINCNGSYTISDSDFEGNGQLVLTITGSSSSTSGQQVTVTSPTIYVDLVRNPQLTADIVAANCTRGQDDNSREWSPGLGH